MTQKTTQGRGERDREGAVVWVPGAQLLPALCKPWGMQLCTGHPGAREPECAGQLPDQAAELGVLGSLALGACPAWVWAWETLGV